MSTAIVIAAVLALLAVATLITSLLLAGKVLRELGSPDDEDVHP